MVPAWVLVAGTALHKGMPKPVVWAAEEVGIALAEHGFGLVTGGWYGVDYITARAFADRLSQMGISADERLIQVIRDDMPDLIKVGKKERTRSGAAEWLGPQNYANAVVLVGGLGGAYGAFLGALNKGLPRFPLGGTGGDAQGAFNQMAELWDLIPNRGITKAEFDALGAPISTQEDARRIARQLAPLIAASIAASDQHDSEQERQPSQIFISYSRADTAWLERLRRVMRPLERTGVLKAWADLDVELGKEWEPEILRKLRTCDLAVLLVSDNFLASEYIISKELPVLIERAKVGDLRLLWLLVAPCLWDVTELGRFQAVAGTKRPLSKMSEAQAQITIVKLARRLGEIARAVKNSNRGIRKGGTSYGP